MKNISIFLTLFLVTLVAQGQVNVKVAQKQTAPDTFDLIFTCSIEEGWHIYSTTEENGPIPTSFNVDKKEGVELVGELKSKTQPLSHYEDVFDANVSYYENSAVFTQTVRITGPTYSIEGYLEYGACNDQNCMPPTSVDFKYEGTGVEKNVEPVKEVASLLEKDGLSSEEKEVVDETKASDTITVNTSSQPSAALGDLWSPVIKELSSYGEQNETSNKSLWAIFGLGFLGGLIALFTPCVWPIIPMTVSFFLKRSKNDKKKGIRDAITYGISIVIIYVSLGLIITLIFGASALNSLSTNAIFNIFFFLMLVVFGASFLGGFEITLPSTWSNAVDNKASSSAGFLSIFLMAFTLSLVSFSCTGPIIGFLLVEMATANIIGPTVGMLGFAIALALPFTFFALFPTLLKSVPKSGNWMNVIKVTLGFIELAFALKFFSVADLAYGWHLMDREVFLCLWIILFALLGAYLIGWIRFPHDEDVYDEEGNVVVNPRTSIPRFFMALISFSFALYMVPGLWGAPCKAVSAFAPPMNTQDFNLAKSDAVEAQFKDYEEGMQYAAAQGKPVLIDFTGFGCVNCRQMEAAVWTDETVKDLIENKYVLISLYVDDKTPLPEIVEVKENGRTRKLRTIGDKWSYFQRTKFGSQTQPFYVLLNNEGKPLNKSYSHDESISNYIEFLNTGLKNYKK